MQLKNISELKNDLALEISIAFSFCLCYNVWTNDLYNISELKNESIPDFYEYDIARDHPVLVDIVETLGNDAVGKYSRLKIVEVPDNIEWTIQEYDGLEWVAEVHRTWD